MTAGAPRLSVVVPVYNEEAWITRSVTRTLDEVQASPFELAEIVVVDDGSTDGTAAAVDELARAHPEVEVVHQENSGRFLARRAGLLRTTAPFVLLVDSRVMLDEGSLTFLADHLGPEATVWNGHVEVHTDGNPFALFWDTMTKIAWAEYFSNPRLTSFGLERFDRYPKGTGCFFAPRELLVQGFEQFSSYYEDLRDASDDTSLIRDIAGTHDIWIGPGFGCSYTSRSTLSQFVRHAFKRGTFFVDGHLRPGARFAPVIAAFYPLSLVAAVVALRRPRLGLLGVGGVVASAAGLTASKRQPPQAALTVGAIAPLFATVYGLGIWRGLVLLIRSRLR